MTIQSLLLAVLVVVAGAALWQVRGRLLAMAEALGQRQTWLREGTSPLFRWIGVDRLQEVANQLLKEHRKHSEAERNYLEQIRATLGSMREAVLIIDGQNRVLMANEVVRELLNLTEGARGKSLESIIQGAEFLDYVQAVKAGQGGGMFVLEMTVGRETRWFEVRGARLPEADPDRGLLTLFVLHDITRLTRLERVRTEFVANLSHELRTPVTIIKGFADTLMEDHESLSARERGVFLEKIQKNVGRLNQMLEELLILSRLEKDTHSLQFEKGSLHGIIRDTAEVFQGRLQSGQTLSLELEAARDELVLDGMRMAQVFENLLENALRHARGFKRLCIETKSLEHGLRCRVSDDGAGIPAKDLPHVFERFYRVDKSRSRESGGTGLGLSIVKHIVQQHGGSISAESVAGRGTRMILELPFPEVLAARNFLSHGANADPAAPAIVRARELSL
jgi:two-component system, OmpR family, phosphate regulon sensor histidine kinase PhoR